MAIDVMEKSPALYPVVTSVIVNACNEQGMIILSCSRMEISDPDTSTKSAHARQVTNIRLIVFLVSLWSTMMRTNMLPMSPSKNTTDVNTNSSHHFAPLDIIDSCSLP